MNSTIEKLPPAQRPPKTNGGYLFLPRTLSRGAFLKWLRRTHAWFGLWGAALGLLFGFTGILLNHHEVMKIPVGRMQQREIQLPLPDPKPANPQGLAAWLGETLNLDTSQAKIRQEPAKTVTWNDQAVRQPGQWQISLRNPNRLLNAEYWEGNAFVTVKQGQANLWVTLNNLHKGVGMGVGWVLLVDTLAGALIVLSLTGTLLWTRLHGTRLAAAGLSLGSMATAIYLAISAIGA